MKFKVGQKWQTRDGRVATIKSTTRDSEIYPIVVTIGDDPFEWTYCAQGTPFRDQVEQYSRDLVRLIEEPLSDGWIEWGGGENPVPGATVEFRLRDNDSCEAEANFLRWDHKGMSGDIVAYRVTEEASSPNPEPFTITEPGEYVTRDGRKVVVVAVNLRGECPVLGYIAEDNWDSACTWGADGRAYNPPSEHPRDIVDRWSPWANLDIDTPVWVREGMWEEWSPRHFAGVKEGKPMCWANGLTSHTAEDRKEEEPLVWGELSLTKPE